MGYLKSAARKATFICHAGDARKEDKIALELERRFPRFPSREGKENEAYVRVEEQPQD
jgi:hypothetical protein